MGHRSTNRLKRHTHPIGSWCRWQRPSSVSDAIVASIRFVIVIIAVINIVVGAAALGH